ncbi:1,4-dihydroxy-2-naphthoate phytyltransferase [Xenococcus sp. PCC 7305]|uniref:2-carboxy-1,4-naphthoquinone phytyltransferase n=1 Tax=Xenococcus sp. PCC 7305 TaxID=102125 RepID=UPI0002AC9D84|nr:2-carboxy-1,4-naphthoquinone phytyltransferase [Xenococcus sp. PCC 7305]ELS01591.1 1,4-dihydroxy-2-naphthoate phytyltransferase [Xenococcus sp. PCC 7305]
MTIELTSELNKPNQRQLWRAAIKLPLYSVIIVPMWVGTAVAIAETGTINWQNLILFLISALVIQTWTNLTNDVFDDETGVDIHKYHSVVKLTGKKTAILWLANGLLIMGLLITGLICWWQRDLNLMIIVVIDCFLGYIYQGPPFRLSYHGVGEILCFFAYSLSTLAFYYAQNPQVSETILASSICVGFATSMILFCSHFHQVEDDLAGGKYSPVVRFGTEKSAQILSWSAVINYSLIGLFVWLGMLPIWGLICLLSVFYAIKLCSYVNRYHSQPQKVSNCKFIAVAMYFWFGLLLGVGIVIPSLIA